MGLFNEGLCRTAQLFQEYEAQVDANQDFIFSIEDLRRWCAPNSNSYNPSANFFYGKIPNEFGNVYLKKAGKEQRSDPGMDPEEGAKTKKVKFEKVDPTFDEINKGAYVNPSLQEVTMGENSYSTGVNIRIEDVPDLNDIVLDQADPSQSISLVANIYSGEYSLNANGVLNERSQKILDKVGKNLEYAYITTPDFATSTYVRGIDKKLLLSMIEEASHEVDGDC